MKTHIEAALKANAISATCQQCGNADDLMLIFTKHKVCGKCTRKNHKKLTK